MGISIQASPQLKSVSKVILDQSDIHSCVFAKLLEDEEVAKAKKSRAILTEYLRVLFEFDLVPQQFLNEYIIDAFVRRKQWYLLQQYIQYKIIQDSKPTACLLLSLENEFPGAYQLAMGE